ncbi:MAG: CDP-alcohol phosphatidyltransferase family protein [Ignavibacteriaceae bacterium]
MNYKEIYTKSNIISLFRLLLAIPLWFLLDGFNSPNIRYITFAVCLIASFSDILDGYLARKYNEVTEFGKIIDPLADKIAVGAIIIKLYLLGQIAAYYFLMIILRDIIIFLGGMFVAKKIGRVLPSNVLGKITVINI